MKPRHPIVFVGAGPGDPELITIKGQKALANADLVLYAGSLVSKAVLGWVRAGAELVDTAPLWLEAILERMTQGYREGRRVVRVHSGDLSLFSAIQEQIDGLEREGIPFTLIPGVTAASAASAVLARELTVPEVTQTVILTRAAGRTPVPEREALAKLARHGSSMAIYLSIQQIDEVAEALASAYGLDAQAVVAYRVSWPEQRLVTGTLATISGKVREAGIKRQALILVGPATASRVSRTQTRSRLYDETFSHGYREPSED